MSAETDDPRRGFLPLLVPVEGHAVVCDDCAALVLDNRNALSAHRDFHWLVTPIAAAPKDES